MQRKHEAVAKAKAAEAARAKKKIVDATVKLESRTECTLEAAGERLEERFKDDVGKRAKQVSVARERARAVEYTAKQVPKLQKRAIEAERKVVELALKLDELFEEAEPEPLFSVPVPKGAKRCRGNTARSSGRSLRGAHRPPR